MAQSTMFQTLFIKLNDTLTIPKLKTLAKSLNITHVAKLKKVDLINTIIAKIKAMPDIDQNKIDEIITSGTVKPDQPQELMSDKVQDCRDIEPITKLNISDSAQNQDQKVKNRGTGAGGANTNANGLSYESNTDLSTEYRSYSILNPPQVGGNLGERQCLGTGLATQGLRYVPVPPNKESPTVSSHPFIKFKDSEKVFICANKRDLYKIMSDMNELNTDLTPASGCKFPDEAYINMDDKHVYIIEKKFQQCSGSVDEKIQTGQFKQYHYRKMFPNFQVSYIYCLSNWFKRPDYKSVLEYLSENKIPVFWGNDPNYKEQISRFLCVGSSNTSNSE